MGLWNKFNILKKEMPDSKEIYKIPSNIKTTALNVNLNKIAVRYFSEEFGECVETFGEIIRVGRFTLVLFSVPDVKGAVILIKKFTYINRTRNNELTLDVCANYPFGIDKNSDLIRFSDIDYQNFRIGKNQSGLSNSKKLYYEDYELFIPVMMNEIPLPIIRLDHAERLTKIDKNLTSMYCNITQTFLRDWLDIKLLQRTGNKNSSGFVYVAILFGVIGVIFGLILSGFIR